MRRRELLARGPLTGYQICCIQSQHRKCHVTSDQRADWVQRDSHDVSRDTPHAITWPYRAAANSYDYKLSRCQNAGCRFNSAVVSFAVWEHFIIAIRPLYLDVDLNYLHVDWLYRRCLIVYTGRLHGFGRRHLNYLDVLLGRHLYVREDTILI